MQSEVELRKTKIRVRVGERHPVLDSVYGATGIPDHLLRKPKPIQLARHYWSPSLASPVKQ